MTNVVRLNEDALNLAILNGQGISLAALVAEDGSSVKFNIEGFCEFSSRISEEADAGAFVGVEGLAPRIHDKWVVDGDNEDLARLLDLGMAHVAWNVGVAACWAESSWDTNDDAVARQLAGQVDLVARAILDQVNAGN